MKNSRVSILSLEKLKALAESDFTIRSHDTGNLLNWAFTWSSTPQGNQYWFKLFNWFTQVLHGPRVQAPTYEDWEFIKSLLPRETPSDSFLLAIENKEFLLE